jgi:hypothetical protein
MIGVTATLSVMHDHDRAVAVHSDISNDCTDFSSPEARVADESAVHRGLRNRATDTASASRADEPSALSNSTGTLSGRRRSSRLRGNLDANSIQSRDRNQDRNLPNIDSQKNIDASMEHSTSYTGRRRLPSTRYDDNLYCLTSKV